MTRRIVGNLDFEQDLAEAGALSAAAANRIAPLATLLRVFARDGDSLWTPAPVDTSLIARVAELPLPRLESGRLDDLAAADRVLAWGQSVSCARLRECAAASTAPPAPGTPLHERLWSLPRAAPEVAKKVNDRRFFLRVATDFGTVLPGSGYFESFQSLREHLANHHAPRFVLKAPFSAAGRSRLIFERAQVDTPQTRDRITALLARFRGALLEPWMDRTDDFGALGLVSELGVAFLGLHRQYVTPEGQFVGVTVRPFTIPTGISKDEIPQLTIAARRAGEALLEAGYRGPYSVDSWRYRCADGTTRVQPIGEINARMTMGLVARAAAQRVFGADCVDEITLRLDDTTSVEGADAVVLLHRPRVVLSRTPIE